MNKNLVKNSLFLAIAGLMIVGNISTYAADEKAVELVRDNSLSVFKAFLQKKRNEIEKRGIKRAEARDLICLEYAADFNSMEKERIFDVFLQRKERRELDRKRIGQAEVMDMVSFLDEQYIKEMKREIENLIYLIEREQLKIEWRERAKKVMGFFGLSSKTNIGQENTNQNLNHRIINYIIAKLFERSAFIRMTFIEILTDPQLPVRISFPSEVIQILRDIARDKSLTDEKMDYLVEENFVPISSPYHYYRYYNDNKSHLDLNYKLGYEITLRATAIITLAVVEKHQGLPFDISLFLTELVTNPLTLDPFRRFPLQRSNLSEETDRYYYNFFI